MGSFRLVRLLGSGTRSRVLLGYDGTNVAAVKVFRPGATPESIDDEIAALSSSSHAHVVQLREVGTASSGLPFLVLERLESTALSAVLLARSRIAPGEAVTILAPLVAAIGALHSSGVAHGSISPGRVLFRATGAPVLVGLGRATLFVPPTSAAMLSSSRPVLEDRLALGRLVQSVLASVDGETGSLGRWLASSERDGYPDGFCDLLLDRVFALGHASPVRFATVAPVPVLPVSMPPVSLQPVSLQPISSQPVPTAIPPVETNAFKPRSLSGLVEGLQSRLPAAVSMSAIVHAARSVRRPIWIAAGLGLGSLVVALLLVPQPATGEAAPPSPTAASSSPVAVASVVEGDDPVSAMRELLDERDRCVRDLSILCLENVAQSGSAAMDDDAALIRSIEGGETTGVALEATAVELVERHGDAALVTYTAAANSEPASALLVKGEAGWRIRDYLAG